jgi:glycine betaine/choline ABC-type transport system substrate-binding protein
MKPVALLSPALIVALGVASFAFRPSTAKPQAGGSKGAANGGVVTIGSKDFTEQFILSEMMAQMLERWTDLRVARKFNLGGTMICHGALKSGAIDLYPEYTGTALTAILKREVISDPDAAFQAVNEAYRQKYGAEWLAPFGFNNTYALTVRQAAAERNGWKTISDLLPAASRLRAGFTSEFAERPDGYPGLKKAYGIRFSSAKDLSPAIMYEALAKKQVDVICAFATDGRIPEYHLQPLRDDKQYFPPYQAAPVVRAATMEAHPEIRDVLARLGGLLDDRTMQQLDGAVDSDKRAPKDVVRAFLEEKQLL